MARAEFTPEVEEKILSYIRSGSFAWVAAAAAGVPKTTFYRWLNDPAKAEFAAKVEEARAIARVLVETQVRKEFPVQWLRLGPGRAKPDEEGWTDQIAVTGPNGASLQMEADLSGLSVEELKTMRDLLTKSKQPAPVLPDVDPVPSDD